MTSTPDRLPLESVRVIELTDGFLDMTGRILADFGAEVIKVEAVGGSDARGRGLRFLVENYNKSGVTIDLSDPDGNDQWWSLLRTADIFIQAGHRASDHTFDPDEVLARVPHLVMLSASDFGSTGPYRDFVATDDVHLAMGSQLSRSGTWPREPALIPFDLAYHSSAAQAAWAAVTTYYRRLMSGQGDHIDFSVFEAAIEVVDPPFGTAGTASAGTKKTEAPTDPYSSEWGRPQSKPYPIYPCADGFVRCLVLAPGQWRAMYGWLGEPEEFSDPVFQTILGRDQHKDSLERAYVELFHDKTKAEIAIEGQQRGIPIAPVLSLTEVAAEEHFRQRGAFTEAELDADLRALIPSGFVEINRQRIGFRHRAPRPGEHNSVVDTTDRAGSGGMSDEAATATARDADSLPLSGLRVIDFGSIVFGAEIGRLFADLGADVIKIENSAFPDKYRGGSEPGSLIAKNFALGNRGRRSFGVDTRAEDGRDLVKRLVATADVVVSNFKPGTLERLGLGYADLSAVNPQIVWMSSSGFGDTGDWASWLAYGPGVRSASGLTSLWRYPDDPSGFGDMTTVYPDHAAARIAGIAIMSSLIGRSRSGRGADIRVSQAEVVINQLSEQFARDALGLAPNEPQGAPWGVFPCAGDDEWCAISVRDDADWANLCAALEQPSWASDARFAESSSRLAHQSAVEELVTEWTKGHAASDVMDVLQAHGVPAGVMNRPPQLLVNPQLIARDYLALQEQPGFDQPLNTVRRPFLARHIDNPPIKESPHLGQHTLDICEEILQMDPADVERLVDSEVLQPSVLPS